MMACANVGHPTKTTPFSRIPVCKNKILYPLFPADCFKLRDVLGSPACTACLRSTVPKYLL